MNKLIEIASVSAAFLFGFVGLVFGQTYSPPMQVPVVLHALPSEAAAAPAPLQEGRSAYRMWDHGAFYDADKASRQTSKPQGPR